MASPIPFFSCLRDPRIERTKAHLLEDILFITICAVICGAESWDDIELFGKSIRGSRSGGGKSIVHMVSAWASENNVVLGQVKVDGKSNEITAIPELLKLLALKGCIVTIDAMGCQKDIAAAIAGKEADYILALKSSQANMHQQAEDSFRFLEAKSASEEADAGLLNRSIRSHWGIENSLHWVLDVAFNEDHSRKRAGYAAQNFSVMNRIALNLLKNDKTVKVGVKGKRLNAGWNEQYLLKLLRA
ncbi:MAG: ISAs1 family transposase [Fibromonadales bacterium]|nr:ISAs1 family transposase [Fibromonadales bacterium]